MKYNRMHFIMTKFDQLLRISNIFCYHNLSDIVVMGNKMLSQHHKSNYVSETYMTRGFTTELSTYAKEIMSQETSLKI